MQKQLAGAARRSVHAIALSLGAIVATSAIALAAIPTNNVIDACYTRSGGALRVIDRTVTNCTKNETSLAWNVQGVKGDNGAIGPQGPAGPSGTSHGFDVDMATTAEIVGQMTVLTKTVPAGKYILVARVQLSNNSSQSDASGTCRIPGDSFRFSIDAGYDEESIALTSAIDHTGGAIELRCEESSTFSELVVSSASMTAIKVDALN